MVHSRILLNDGTSAVLLNDGTSYALLNAVGPPHVQGIEISGTHAIADLRGLGAGRKPKKKSRQICFIINGKVSCIYPMPTGSKLFKTVETKVRAKISRIINPKTESKLWRSKNFESKARIDRSNRINVDSKLPFSVYEKQLREKLKEFKLKKIKKLWDAYKESQDE